MSFLSNYSEGQKNFGLLFLRIGIGAMFIMHGYPKLLGGPHLWADVGAAMKNIGVDYVPVVWGFLAGLAEAGGGLLLILGIMFRPACFFMLFTMFVASTTQFSESDTLMKNLMSASHPIELSLLFFCLLFTGPGNYRLQKVVIE